MAFTLARRDTTKLRILLDGPSGSGKTLSALLIARGLVGPEGRVGVLDTQNGQSARYVGRVPWRFGIDVMRGDFSPVQYAAKIKEAEAAKLDVLIIDSVTHEWAGRNGALQQVDQLGARMGGSSNAWKNVTPLHMEFVDAIVQAPFHVIVTCRTKTAWVYEPNANGKITPRRVGTDIVQRDQFEYEFDVWLRMDMQHTGYVEKSVIDGIEQNAEIELPGDAVGKRLAQWLTEAEEQADEQGPAATVATPALAPDSGSGEAEAAQLDEGADVERARYVELPDEPEADDGGDELPMDAATAEDDGDPFPTDGEPPHRQAAATAAQAPTAGQQAAKPAEAGTGKAPAQNGAPAPSWQPCEECGTRIYPHVQETYQGHTFTGRDLINVSTREVGKVLCAPHFATARKQKRAAEAGKAEAPASSAPATGGRQMAQPRRRPA